MWHHPKELTKIEDFSKPIIYWTWNNKCGVFKDNILFFGRPENVGTLEQHINSWLNKCEKYAIKWWQFQDEIAPAGILSNGGGGLSDWYGCAEEDITHEMWDAIGNKDTDKVKQLCNKIKINEDK